jgi:hypothetical protein
MLQEEVCKTFFDYHDQSLQSYRKKLVGRKAVPQKNPIWAAAVLSSHPSISLLPVLLANCGIN